MKRFFLMVVMALGLLVARGQYDIIPMPQRISLDAKGAVLNIEGRPHAGGFGVNPLFLYVFSECLAVVGWSTGINEELYASMRAAIAVPSLASLCYALTFVAIVGLVGWLLYWRKIFIKI